MIKNKIYATAIAILLINTAFGQFASSPMNSMGVGQINGMGLVQNRSMGGLGIGTGSYWNLNNINPALLVYSRGTIFNGLTVFQTSLLFENKNISDPSITEKSSNGGLNYLVTGFPVIMNKWFTSLGLMPYSSANYNLNYSQPVIGQPDLSVNVFEEGSGGLNSFFMSHGVNITKNLSLGLTANLLFGSRIREYTNSVDITILKSDPTNQAINNYNSTLYQRNNNRGFIFTGGFAYQDSIKISGKDPLKVTIGLIYDFKKGVQGKQFESIERRTSSNIVSSDTLKNDVKGEVVFPSGFGGGFSLSQGFKWNAGLDVGVKNYNELLSFGEVLNSTKTFYLKTGVEFTPNAFSVDGYMKRVTYRMGSSFQKTPYLINGMAVKDFGINFGASFPIVPSTGANSIVNKGFSSVDLGFEYGVQGNLTENLLREEYFRFNFGVTFNDKWFVRRKFN